MTSMNVSLPDQMKDWVDSKITGGQYHNVSEYVRDLIRKDQAEAERIAAFQGAINLGRSGGRSDRSFKEIIAGAKKKAKRV